MARGRQVILFLVMTALAVTALTWGTESSAQQAATPEVAATSTPLPTPTAHALRLLKLSVIAQATLPLDVDGDMVVTSATASLPAGAVSLPFVAEGWTVIAVTAGSVTVDADQATISVVDLGRAIGLDQASASPTALTGQGLAPGEQVTLSPGATVTLRNDGEANATVTIVTVVPSTDTTAP